MFRTILATILCKTLPDSHTEKDVLVDIPFWGRAPKVMPVDQWFNTGEGRARQAVSWSSCLGYGAAPSDALEIP